MIENARYINERGEIEVIIDGVTMIVPPDPANRHYIMLEEWIAAGGDIKAYEAPDDGL